MSHPTVYNAMIARMLAAATLLAPATRLAANELPQGFVYLRDVDPTIQQDIRYAGSANFVGHAIPGYDAAECVLVRQAANVLKAVQTKLKEKQLSLKVYDCYRPARAVGSFVDWAKTPDQAKTKSVYYPALAKRALFPDYIATRSGHSRGATVDLTLVPLDTTAPSEASIEQNTAACTAPKLARAPDNGLDMGTSFDCFDTKANTAASGLTEDERQNRAFLVDVMGRSGFKNYEKEWWHFTLENEPYPNTIFDFPISPRE
jgi:D-alanyl-D-alanine dipeptidase